MTSIGHLYWILLETNLSGEDLYFPADTPIGHVNPKRHYNFLKKRHIRQRERLIRQQVNELDDYQKKFSIEYKEDLFIKPTISATELVSGSEFLASSGTIISDLLSTIPNVIIENQNKVSEKSREKEFNANKQEYSDILKKKYDTGLEALNKIHNIQWDTLSNAQASDLEVIPKEYQDPPPKSTSTSHCSKHRSSPKSPPYYDSDKRPSGPGSISPPRKRVMEYSEASDKYYKKRRDARGEGEKERRRKERRNDSRANTSTRVLSPSVKARHEMAIGTSQRVIQGVPKMGMNSKTLRNLSGQNPSELGLSLSGRPPTVGVHPIETPPVVGNTVGIPPGGRPPVVGRTVGIPPGGRPPVVGSTVGIPPGGRPPTVGSTVGIPPGGRPPIVGSAVGIPSGGRPPIVGSSSSSSNGRPRPPRKDAGFTTFVDHRRDSLPLFGSTPINHKITSLLDRGTIAIFKKPNRVIIRGPNGTSTNYGDPKDYDDAINSSVERPDNPVYKRHTQGKDYLFYKTESGTVVTIGPVSKIQPLIHKFFLSM